MDIPATQQGLLPGFCYSLFQCSKAKIASVTFAGAAIVRGEKYAIVTVSKDDAELVHALTESEPSMAPTISVDSRGNLRLDLCLNCRLNTRFPGDETVQ